MEMVLRDSARDVVSSVANCCPDHVLSCRFVAAPAPGVLEDPDFEVAFLVIHAVKIYEKSVEGSQCLALPMESLECRKTSGFLVMARNSKIWNARVIREPADGSVTTSNRGYLGTSPVVCRNVEAPRSWG